MKLHREGFGTIVFALILLFLANLALFYLPAGLLFIPIITSIISLIIFILILWFFRNPKRTITPDNNIIISPADGKVVVIEKTTEHEFLKKECWQISIFMSPLNVHVNWYPVNGLVNKFFYHKGKYLVAWHPKSSTENERSSVLIETINGEQIVLRQIAGAVARRIVTYAEEGNQSLQNKQLGFIKFGSRVDLFLPLNAEIEVKVGQKVKGNQSIIGYFG
ncbi:MAG: phosphatidylserine decarboxylase family protein [Bacteroidales bacterium]|nr:phosphatidylserine decarboxylase family protein [Bacteroidales bacterium]